MIDESSLDDLVDRVGEVLIRRGWDLAADDDAALVRDTVEITRRIESTS